VNLVSIFAAAFVLSSPAFTPGQTIPTRYTCDGVNRSPALRWTPPLRGTRSLALLMDDPDAPSGRALVRRRARTAISSSSTRCGSRWRSAQPPIGVPSTRP
jgi:phosphatidylethanolamine-binding protein (PEBP) family uncharacterized protein